MKAMFLYWENSKPGRWSSLPWQGQHSLALATTCNWRKTFEPSLTRNIIGELTWIQHVWYDHRYTAARTLSNKYVCLTQYHNQSINLYIYLWNDVNFSITPYTCRVLLHQHSIPFEDIFLVGPVSKGYFWAGNFSRIDLFQISEGQKFHESSRPPSDKYFSKGNFHEWRLICEIRERTHLCYGI